MLTAYKREASCKVYLSALNRGSGEILSLLIRESWISSPAHSSEETTMCLADFPFVLEFLMLLPATSLESSMGLRNSGFSVHPHFPRPAWLIVYHDSPVYDRMICHFYISQRLFRSTILILIFAMLSFYLTVLY